MRRFRKYLVEFFGFSHGESKGFIILLGFVIVFFALSSKIPALIFINNYGLESNSEKIDSFLEGAKLKSPKTSFKQKEKIQISDPNTMSFFDWTNIGLDQKLANRIISYRLHGGFFREKSDLKKVYGLSDSIYSEIDQYLRIKELEKPPKKYSGTNYTNKKFDEYETSKTKIPIKKPDLNSCDSTELLFIKGIGSARASRIIKYRSKLGGFNNKNQLSEVFGLDSLVLENLMANTVLVNDSALSKMDLNSISFKDLLKHPYVDYNTCKVILNFRNQHGAFNSIDDLKKIKIIDNDFISKIEPYIQFQ